MGKIAVIFGSSTGTCETIAETIASKLGAEVINVYDLKAEMIAEYDTLLLGSSTWGYGELQDDWYDGVKLLKAADLAGKSIAFFGCGDADSYCDTFCDAMGLIYQEIEASGASFIGAVSTDGYSFDSSVSVVDDKFIGLAIDDVNESDKTEERVENWVSALKEVI